MRYLNGKRAGGNALVRGGLLAAGLLLAACGSTGPSDDGGFGANRNWAGKYLRVHLLPRQEPVLGEYSSRDPLVIQQHVTWANRAGIDFFAIPWRGTGSWGHETLADYLVPNASFAGMTWCLIYETPTVLAGSPDASTINLTQAARDTLLQHLLLFRDRFFGLPNYLRLGGRPVIFLRKSRLIAGDARIALNAIRIAYADSTGGESYYLVGDEAIWGAVGAPDASRISAMDAITGIDLAVLPAHNGYPQGTGFVNDLDTMWREYALAGSALDPPVPLFPTVLPGFNDRAAGPSLHPVISRELSAVISRRGGSYEAIWNVAGGRVGSPAVVLLNSFNDWQRDTQIEPVADNGNATGTAVPGNLTAGLRYFPYGSGFVTDTAAHKGLELLGAIYEVWYDNKAPGGRY